MKNYLYDLPDELQAEIYKKVFNNVIKELIFIVNTPLNHVNYDLKCGFWNFLRTNPQIKNYKVKDAIYYTKVLYILEHYSHLPNQIGWRSIKVSWNGSLGRKYIDSKYTYYNQHFLNIMIYNSEYDNTKNGIYSYLYYTNKQRNVYKTWTKKRMIQYCMKM